MFLPDAYTHWGGGEGRWWPPVPGCNLELVVNPAK